MHKNWKIAGLAATFFIVLSLPLYLVKFYLIDGEKYSRETMQAQFVGRENCIDCHKKEYDLWRGSHHDMAMDTASAETVLGNFENAEFVFNGDTSRFYRRGEKFFVKTPGQGGKIADFEITYVFGVTPLQQYLIPFEGGRLQCLPIAWDTERKQWFHLVPMVYPGQEIMPSDWLYWSNGGQNWNGMCAECHSTNVQKNYNLETGTYNTTWSEIDVSCEACHGPGSLHVAWAQVPEMARTPGTNYDLSVQTSGIDAKRQVELCAPCHSRRSQFADNPHHYEELLDIALPQLITEPHYFTDGQILEEDYEYGSFLQSKMYEKGVRCSDCHNVHSGKIIETGNRLCAQCHRPDIYDAYSHHFHKYPQEQAKPLILEQGKKKVAVGEGALCVSCHMPGRYYMGVDFRRDHSMRAPRPDLSLEIGVPNACNQCHSDKPVQWAVDQVNKWYGISRPGHFGQAFAKAGKGDPGAEKDLIEIINEPLYAPLVRASALSLLSSFASDTTAAVFQKALQDPSPVLRSTAVSFFNPADRAEYLNLLIPLLNDPVKTVRILAASQLAGVPEERLTDPQKQRFRAALEEYHLAMEYGADFPASRHNLGNLYASLGDFKEAEHHYRIAIEIDNLFIPPKVNLAMMYNRFGKNEQAERMFREIIRDHPEFDEAYYSLGLLLAEMKQFEEAAQILTEAGKRMPGRSRIFYNLGLIYQYLQNYPATEKNLLRALQIEPENFDYLYAITDYCLKTNQLEKARMYARRMKQIHPANQAANDILNFIDQKAAQ